MIFLLSYNPFDEKVTAGQVDGFVRANRNVREWYCPFIGTFYMKSSENLNTLTESFRPMFGVTPFIVTQFVPAYQGGGLAPAIWTWVNATDAPVIALTGIRP